MATYELTVMCMPLEGRDMKREQQRLSSIYITKKKIAISFVCVGVEPEPALTLAVKAHQHSMGRRHCSEVPCEWTGPAGRPEITKYI